MGSCRSCVAPVLHHGVPGRRDAAARIQSAAKAARGPSGARLFAGAPADRQGACRGPSARAGAPRSEAVQHHAGRRFRCAPRRAGKLLDFGIVKICRVGVAPPDVGGHTRRGMILGTPLYMAPEQWKTTAASTARRTSMRWRDHVLPLPADAVRAPDTPGLGFLHCYKVPPSLDSKDPTLPPLLVDLVARMFAKDSERRPTMEQVAETLGRLLPRSGIFEKLSVFLGSSDVEISIQAEPDTTERLGLDDSPREVQTAEAHAAAAANSRQADQAPWHRAAVPGRKPRALARHVPRQLGRLAARWLER